MSATLLPEHALSPEGFYALYLGSLSIEDETQRTDACLTILLIGRLGLRPGELIHLHEGWIDWTRGELRVPGYDPCACDVCWEQAQQQAQHSERDAESILRDDCWQPQGTTAPRMLSFGWSNRLTGALRTTFQHRQYLPYTEAEVRSLLGRAATHVDGIDQDAISVGILRATALEFLASAGFGPRRLAELTVTTEETAGAFARVSGGEVRNHLYRELAGVEPPAICGDNPRYPLVCESTPIEREPFDPRAFDTDWRVERSAIAESSEHNPRPPASAVPFDLDARQPAREPAGETGPSVVAESLREWIRQDETARIEKTSDQTPAATTPSQEETALDIESPDRESGEPDPAQPAMTADSDSEDAAVSDPSQQTAETLAHGDPDELVTEPVAFSIDTRFAAATLEGGRPTGGSVILGQAELLFLSRDDTGIAGHLRIDHEDIVDLAPGYNPEGIDEVFEETVGVAYCDATDERHVVVCEVPANVQWAFVQTIFSYVLAEFSAIVSYPQETGADIEGAEMAIRSDDRTLVFEDPRHGDDIRLQLSRIIDVEETRMTHEEGLETGLEVSYLSANDVVRELEIRPTDERLLTVLHRHLVLHRNRLKQRARAADVDYDHYEVLEALYNTGEGRDLMAILDIEPARLSDVISSLTDQALVREREGGIELTGAGFLVVDEEYGVS